MQIDAIGIEMVGGFHNIVAAKDLGRYISTGVVGLFVTVAFILGLPLDLGKTLEICIQIDEFLISVLILKNKVTR